MNEEAPAKTRRITGPLIALLLIVPLLLIAIFVGITLSRAGGAPAADFTLPLLGTEDDFTLSEYRGQVVLINVFGSWCGPCRDEAPILQAAWEDFMDRDVVFVGIAVDDTEADALAYIEEFGITYLNVIDHDDEIERSYNVYGVPVTLILGRDGAVRHLFFSRPDEGKLRQEIEDAL